MVSAWSGQVARQFHRTMKYTKDVYRSFSVGELSDAVVSVEQNADIAFGFAAVEVADLRMVAEQLRLLVDPCNNIIGSGGVVLGYVLVDILKPAQRFLGPSYFRHEWSCCST